MVFLLVASNPFAPPEEGVKNAMARTSLENISRLRYTVTALLCVCSALAGYYWARVLDAGVFHIHGHVLLVGAFFFSLAALVFAFTMEVLAERALKVNEKLVMLNLATRREPFSRSRLVMGTRTGLTETSRRLALWLICRRCGQEKKTWKTVQAELRVLPENGAARGNRTHDLSLTKGVLYH